MSICSVMTLSEIREMWRELIYSLPQGLSQQAAATHLKVKPCTARLWMKRYGYHSQDGRKTSWTPQRRILSQTLRPDKVDWSESNINIARMYNVSRERVRQVRNRLAAP